MPRFVILEHDHPFLHWDLMLESAGVLRTWRLLQQPRTGVDIQTESLSDHRLEYLDYEGPVPGDRGRVTRWDAGEFEIDEQTPSALKLRLDGQRIQGRASITVDCRRYATLRVVSATAH